MFTVVPLGIFVGAEVFDALFYFGGRTNPTWSNVAYWMTVAGLMGGVVAAASGWIDWFAIPKGTRAKTVGLVHEMCVLGLSGRASFTPCRESP